MAENFKCTGNCLNCLPAQRAYCASQHSYSNMKVLDAMMAELLSVKETITILAEKIEAIQNNEAAVFSTTDTIEEDTTHTIAQEGDGAEE